MWVLINANGSGVTHFVEKDSTFIDRVQVVGDEDSRASRHGTSRLGNRDLLASRGHDERGARDKLASDHRSDRG
jgi:hypothetical protein